MDPQYDHKKFESEIYKVWQKGKTFEPKGNGQPFTIIMPPPNANDPLHIGHARFVAIEDTLIRYHRMKGDKALWLPGSDHAGIETQYVFEKKLAKEGKSRFDFDRETLYKMIWDYVQTNTGVVEEQFKKLGASCDWNRFKFSLDPEIIKVVYSTFKKLDEKGLLYRGKRIVNYCIKCGTAYSQLEVNSIEQDNQIYYLDYGVITIATTRPETIFADVAIAVNPKDKRYKNIVGLNAKIPLINREVPVIEDNHVDKDFGTGALKITPAHDATDFDIGEAHDLPILSVVDKKGRMVNCPEKYVGMKTLEARELVVKDLQQAGYIKRIDKIRHTIGTCYRDHSILEPMISTQWFIKVEPLAKAVLLAIKNHEVVFAAKKYEKIAIHWLKNLRDWNISRQIVWGIRIPAWECEGCKKWTITDGDVPTKCQFCDSLKLKQDSDTFDTWFSSGQWPFATLKTTKANDFETFYPTSVMETGYDILPFWVIRMLMLGIFATGKVPFKDVLLHGLVRDGEGQKISKSKGNVINPIEMAEKYGADALRMGLLWGALIENDVSLSEQNINAQRKFANKIWNAARFVKDFEGKENDAKTTKKFKDMVLQTVKESTNLLDKFKLSNAAETLYSRFWGDFCDVGIENAKKGLISANDMRWGLNIFLRLLHPFMPFLTEQIWRQIGNPDLLITTEWPKA